MITADQSRSFAFGFGGPGGVGLGVVAGGFRMVDGADAVRQAILLLLSTAPGERVMRPTYGCDLNKVVFLPNDDTTAGLAIHYVRQAVDRWEPRVEVVRVDAGRRRPRVGAAGDDRSGDPSGDRLYVALDYRLRRSGRADHVTMTVDLAGGRA